ncbi:MAG TPA: hypothetical protein VIL41_02705 [Coriobacteriia bacterium]
MVQTKPTTPAGHGELLARPAFENWAGLAAANHAAAATWSFSVAGRTACDMRALARREALERAAVFSARLGVPVDTPGDPDALVVATGHQPELYHPGIWIKDFLLQRLAEETKATAFDLVVDSDTFDVVSVSSPCLTPEVSRCTQYLAVGSRDTCYACTQVPSERDIEVWIDAVGQQISSLPAPAVRRHFAEYAAGLRSSRADAENLAELVTFARRRFEAGAATTYLELPATSMARSEAFAAFVVDMALSAHRFAVDYNAALADYRVVNKSRSAAQPFPDLTLDGGSTELPLWNLFSHGRQTVWAKPHDAGVRLLNDDGSCLADLPSDPEEAIAALLAAGIQLAPKALALTLFARGFACDLFIHGVGGGGYDGVTDDVMRRYYGVEPPSYVVASITMYLPLGMHAITDEEISAARERLNRLEHNPDAMLGDVEFDDEAERHRAIELAAEKSALVSAIGAPDADKKALGLRIRNVNAELAALLSPLRDALSAELAALESQRAASEILTDRTYPLCFWSPLEVADKAR